MNQVNGQKSLLFIVTQGELGGAQRHIFDLANALKNEYKITVATGADTKDGIDSEHISEDLAKSNALNAKIKELGLPTHAFKHLVREINPWHDFLAILEIAKFLRQNNFDLIHLHSSKAGVIGALANTANRFFNFARLPRSFASLRMTKIIYTAHGWVFLEPLGWFKKNIYLAMEKIASSLRYATIVLSEKEKKVALRYGTAKPNSIFVIPNGIFIKEEEFKTKEEARKKLNLPQDKIIIGAIANLYPTKGIDVLIEAADKIAIDKNILFVVIGEGRERKKLESKILLADKRGQNQNLKNNFYLIGAIPNAYKYLKAFDIFVLPSRKEGFPYTLLEAMTAGLPIIATDVGAISEIIENKKDGLLVASADSLAIEQAIAQLFNNPENARRLGANAKDAIKKFDLDAMIEKTKKIYLLRLTN